MTQPSPNYYAVRDRETLLRLDSGLEIIRAKKHESISLTGMKQSHIEQITNKVNGSKFARTWTLERYVQWLQGFLDKQDWLFPPSQQRREAEVFAELIGIAAGRESHTIEIVVRGRYAHAYPIEDE